MKVLKMHKIMEASLGTAVGSCYPLGLTACVVYGKSGDILKD
jgi:hypothetical protein